MPDQVRGAELVSSLGALRNRIAAACVAAGRETSEITLVAVTKTYPAADVLTLAGLGVLDVGENRDQEARAKAAEVAEQLPEGLAAPRWHFVGQLQRKKARSVASYAHAVHSVDRSELVDALAAAVEQSGRPALEVFVQVSLDGDPSRGGVVAADLPQLGELVSARASLRLRGLMAVAPLGIGPDDAFAELARIDADFRARFRQADALSAGMSQDLDAAIRHGATHLRVGTALLGRRTPAFG
jgi:pyridoxal phosphate enzyme (YggS family)